MNNIVFNVGVYIRLSHEDLDSKEESESITNQKSLLLQYVKENNLSIYDIYIDDGYSGTNFNRPAFKKLLSDIEDNNVNMVLTKDMSRLGRDYIETGNFIEKYFPSHNVRYVAITDNIDTFLDSSNNDIAPFKAIMNDMYAKDISKKIRSSLMAKKKEGKWVSGRVAFGYKKDPLDKNHLIIDSSQAEVVKRIYKMCLEGLTCFKIAKILTIENVKNPSAYYNFVWKKNSSLKIGSWNAKTIKDILTNRIYIGDLVQGKRYKINYKIKKIARNDPSKYIVVENTHEAIIDRNTFFEVQKLIPKNVGRCEKKEKHLLDGLLYCGDCGHRISVTSRRKKDNNCYTVCNYYRAYIKEKVCTTHSNNYDLLEKKIINELKKILFNFIDVEKIKKSINEELSNMQTDNIQEEIKMLNLEINKLNENLDEVYIDKLNKVIDDEQFSRVKDRIYKNLEIKNSRRVYLMKTSLEKRKVKEKFFVEQFINDYLSMSNVSRELIVQLIEKIEIFDDKRINLILTFGK